MVPVTVTPVPRQNPISASFPMVAYLSGWSASTRIQMAKPYGHIGRGAARREIERQPIQARKRPPHKGPHNGSNACPGPEKEIAAN